MKDMIPEMVKVVRYRRETDDSFTIRLDKKIEHMPGQFLIIGLPGIGECPISICSYSDSYIELHIRQVGNVTNALAKLKAGDKVWIRGPYGNGYPMDWAKDKDIVLIGGGCGVAPIRGVIEYLMKNINLYANIHIFLGFRNERSIAFAYDMDKWKKSVKLNISLDRIENKSGCKIDAKEGFVTELLKEFEPEKKTIAMMCGPEIMMKFASKILIEKGIRKKNIFVSLERLMYCGVGKCCHCMLDNGLLVCKHGPVFSLEEVEL